MTFATADCGSVGWARRQRCWRRCAWQPPSVGSLRYVGAIEAATTADRLRAKLAMVRFRWLARRRRKALEGVCGEQATAGVISEAIEAYRELLPEVLALSSGVMNGALAGAYEYLAYVAPLRRRGYDDEAIGGFFVDSFEQLLDAFPTRLMRYAYRSIRPHVLSRLRREAAASQSHDDPQGWRFTFVEADGDDHLGWDVTNCAVCHLYARHDAEGLVPYLCSLDDTMSAALGMEMRRSGTRARGAACCDFRYPTRIGTDDTRRELNVIQPGRRG